MSKRCIPRLHQQLGTAATATAAASVDPFSNDDDDDDDNERGSDCRNDNDIEKDGNHDNDNDDDDDDKKPAAKLCRKSNVDNNINTMNTNDGRDDHDDHDPREQQQQQQQDHDNDDDWAGLLAGTSASLQRQDAYEDAVFQSALLQDAPTLTVQDVLTTGFPSANALAPLGANYSAAVVSASTVSKGDRQQGRVLAAVAAPDVPHVHTVLAQIRHELQQQIQLQHAQATSNDLLSLSSSSSSSFEQLLLQEQLLLHYLHHVAAIPITDLPPSRAWHDPAFQRQHYQRRRRKQQKQRPAADSEGQDDKNKKNDNETDAVRPGRRRTLLAMRSRNGIRKNRDFGDDHDQPPISSSLQQVNHQHHARVSMMQRKKRQPEGNVASGPAAADADDNGLDLTEAQRKELRQLRHERKRRRWQRHALINDEDQSRIKNAADHDDEMEWHDSNKSNEGQVESTTSIPTTDPKAYLAQDLNTANADTTAEFLRISNDIADRQPDTVNADPSSLDVVVAGSTTTSMELAKDTMVIEADASATTSTTTTTATCPLCQESITADAATDIDATLAAHLDQCQSQQSRPRRTRLSTAASQSTAHTATKTRSGTSAATTTQSNAPQRRTTRSVKATTRPAANAVATAQKLASIDEEGESPPAATDPPASLSLDDLNESHYEDRVDAWIEQGLSQMKVMKERNTAETPPWEQLYPGGLLIPAWINDRLFGYQREGLQWMWQLHQQEAGGILGDEMGLGKTVQIASYLGCLAGSRKLRSALVVVPATMLQHWLNELAVWAPGLRRILIHPSGETDGISRTITQRLLRSLDAWLTRSRRERLYEPIDEEDLETMEQHSFCGTGFAVVTTYENIRRNPDIYGNFEWSYVVLDEAQKIRNPDADVTLACKRIRTPHRIAMSGTPIQNSLTELWSLFDFSNAGLLGTLPAFEQEFADPIRRGGYSNATPLQVQLAYRCALILRDIINPYLLRRQKKDVEEVSRMPGKTEHVLFCRLTDRQRAMYEAYLRSDEVALVMRNSSTKMFAAITMLRKICNPPDLVCEPDQSSLESFLQQSGNRPPQINGKDSDRDDDDDGNDSLSELNDQMDGDETIEQRSGKLEVLSKILPLWHKQGHRVLIFCQWRKMLNIIQRFTMSRGWKFGRLDGNTSVGARQTLVDKFNRDTSYFGMLCTTRTGGVGLNLTSANRVILYDPDWNPQTDAQARERSWRFGQEKEVTIYRLITAGTVEEKIYQRQIFKTALSNKVLQDPRQRRLFSQRDLRDLFTLRADNGSVISGGDGMTETARVTRGVGVLDPEVDVMNDTLKDVMKSKGLAGVFDHHYVESDPARKTATARDNDSDMI